MNSCQLHEQLLNGLKKGREKLIKEIKNALTYKSISHRVGVMSMCKIINILGGTYGLDQIDNLLKKTSIKKLHQAHKQLDNWGFIKLGKDRAYEIKSGAKFCPHCGGRLQ